MWSKLKPIHVGIILILIVFFSMRQAPKLDIVDHPSASTRNGVVQFSYLPKGKWIKGRSSDHAAPICCGWDDGHYLKVPECGTVPMPRVNGGGKILYLYK